MSEPVSKPNPYRLSRNVIPERYELTLTPDLGEARFSGDEKIQISIGDATSVIALNAVELELLSAQLTNDQGAQINGTVAHDEEAEVATITLGEVASPGHWTLHITFTGLLNDKLRGFYRSTFKDDSGTDRVIATTQFEATDARRAFPCWDEPDFKATFGVTLIVDNELAAFSNGAVLENDSLGNGKRQVRFADTMKMSTYLVAFIVGPLVETEVVDVDGVPLRVACVPGREALASFALEAGAAALRYFGRYFGIPYPGGKLDLIALPDFAFGAMENLGCVTFRETALLVDTNGASRVEVERVADVVGHEIAHMWFGDLVTMKWWNGIWLNEAFATFMEVAFVDQFRPEWQRWVSFGLGKSAAMSIDSLASTRPIEFEVVKPEEAQGMFDLLTYEKGGAVLRMLEQHLGSDVFAQGISAYLNKHSYANAETTDLWDALEQSSGQPVRSMMDTWIFQGGHPIVHVKKGADGTTLELSQHRFRYIDSATEPSPLWHVPVGIKAANGKGSVSTKTLLTTETGSVSIPGDTAWVLVNQHSNGFFRVSYEPELLAQLMQHLDELEPIERFTLMTDTWAACLAGHAKLQDVLSLVQLMRNDTDPNVWSVMLGPISLVDKSITDQQREKFVAMVQSIALPLYEKLGWEPQANESDQISTLRGVVIGTLGGVGEYEPVRTEALRRYELFQTDTSAIDPDLVGAVEGILAATNDPANYDRLYQKFKAEGSTPQESVRALGALASFTDEALVDRTLQMILDGKVRSQDGPYTVRTMLARRQAGLKVWKWVEQNWPTLANKFPDNSITRMVDGVTGQVSPQLANDVETFMAANPVPQAQKSIDQSIERLRVNAAFYQTNLDAFGHLFD